MVELESIEYIKNSEDVDDSYGNKDNKRDAKDINFDLKNAIKNKLYITVPSNINGVNYSNYIVKGSDSIEQNTIQYSKNMTIAEKLLLLQQMKENIRDHIITNLKGGRSSDFYEDGREKIPFVAYWKWITPLEKPTHITLSASPGTSVSWVKQTTITAKLYDNSNNLINGVLLCSAIDNQNHTTTNGVCTLTVPTQTGPGTKTFEVVYHGASQEYEPCNNSITITFTKDTPTLKALTTTTSIYSGYHAVYQLVNSQGKAIPSTKIQIQVGSNAYKDYTTDSNGKVSITVTQAETIKYKFGGDAKYNSVAEKSQKFTIKSNPTKSTCCGSMSQSPTSRQAPYQIWSDLTGDCTTTNYLRCGHESTGYNNVYTLGSKSGTFHRPAVLSKTFSVSIPSGATIKSVHVKWSEKQTNGPSASTSKTSFINIKTVTLTVSGATSYTKTINTNSGGSTNGGKWVAHDLTLSTNFNPSKKVTLKLAYGDNESVNPGSIFVKVPQIIVEYIPKE